MGSQCQILELLGVLATSHWAVSQNQLLGGLACTRWVWVKGAGIRSGCLDGIWGGIRKCACACECRLCVCVCTSTLSLVWPSGSASRRGEGGDRAVFYVSPVRGCCWRQCLVCGSLWPAMSVSSLCFCVSLRHMLSFSAGWTCNGKVADTSLSMGRDPVSLRWAPAAEQEVPGLQRLEKVADPKSP